MPLEGQKYALEDYALAYVVSGRDLDPGGGRPAHGPALVMADPDFALDPDQARLAARAVLRRADGSSADALALRGTSDALRLDAAPRLPGTAAEARAIAPKLRAYAGTEPVVYTDRWALETVFKAFRRPRVVVLSTHGFFLDQPESNGERPSLFDLNQARPRSGQPLDNPLLRCGLLLAGCNHRRTAGDGEDGVLTGLEIVSTDFRRQFPPNSEREKPCSGPAITLPLADSAGRQRRGLGRVGVGVGEPCPYPHLIIDEGYPRPGPLPLCSMGKLLGSGPVPRGVDRFS